MPTPIEREAAALIRFAAGYEVWGPEVSRLINLETRGADVGANGYTTMAQADQLPRAFALRQEGHCAIIRPRDRNRRSDL